MATRIYNITLLLFATLLLAGCNEEKQELEKERATIRLSSNKEIGNYATRAEDTDFPNDGRIGVIAALYNTDSIDWTSYSDIDNEPAVTTGSGGGTYEFNWENGFKYWPFDGTPLVFNAYTPYTTYTDDDKGDENAKIRLRKNRSALEIDLHEGMEDIMYAAGNATAAQTPYDKHSEKVHLGEFRHVMSKLTIEVIAEEGMNPDTRIHNLQVSTTRSRGILSMQNGLMAAGEDKNFTYSLISGIEDFRPMLADTVLLFPETENDITIMISVGTGNPDDVVDISYSMSSFKNLENEGEELKLEAGKNTVLRIRVSGVPVREEDDMIKLEGILSEWIYKGDFGVIIQ